MDTAYNVQTAVDTDTHLMMDYHMTNRNTDHGLMAATMEEIKKVDDEPAEMAESYAIEEMKERAEEGFYVRDPQRDKEKICFDLRN